MPRKIHLTVGLIAAGLIASAAPAHANHSWANWHWERASNPFTLPVLNSTSDTRNLLGGQNWPAMLAKSASDWSQSTVLDLAVQPQTATDLAARAACAFQPGAVRVCNAPNPDVTWLGLATVFPDATSGDGHLLAATAQMNDTWFSTPFYNATNAQHVMCQEIGHTFGLDHQDESGKDLNTCMDYAEALDNPAPNSHDYQQLQTIYGHLDGASSAGSRSGSKGRKGNAKGGAARAIATGGFTVPNPQFPRGYHGTGDRHGRPHSDVFVTEEAGQIVVRHVLWAY